MGARKMTELTVMVRDQVGELARVLGIAAQAGADVIAFCGYGHGSGSPGGEILIVPEKAEDKVQAALEKAGYTVFSHPILAITGAAGRGMGARLAEKFGKESINILYSYASRSVSGDSTAIFRVERPDEALRILKS